MRAYRPLTDAMIGKRWVLQFDPLEVSSARGEVPGSVKAEIFRIDRHAPHGGTVVVAVADLNRSRLDRTFTKGLAVTARLPEAARYKKASWLGVERSGKPPVRCKTRRRGRSLTIQLPPVGAAGILRLSR